MNDFAGLTHFLETSDITSPGITTLLNNNFKIIVFVAGVRLITTQVPINTGTAQGRTGDTEINRVLSTDDTDVLNTLLPDLVASQQALISIQMARHRVDEVTNLFIKTLRKISREATNAEIVRGHPSTRNLLVDIHDVLTLAKSVDENRHGADIESMTRQPDQVALEAGQFGEQNPHNLRTLWNLIRNTKQLFHGQYVAEVVMHGSQVVESIGQGQHLVVSTVFRQLLYTAVQKANMRCRFADNFAIQLEDQLQHPVS